MSLCPNPARRPISFLSTESHGRLVGGTLVLLVAGVLILSTPGVAYGGTYVMRSCNVPGTSPAPGTPWGWIATSSYLFPNEDCASGGGFGLNAGRIPSGGSAAVALSSPDPSITIRRIRLWLVARLGGSGPTMYVLVSSGGHITKDAVEYIFSTPGGESLRSPWTSAPLAPDTTSYLVILACSGGSSEECTPSSATPLDIRGAEATLSEDNLPSGGVTGGSLLMSGSRAGEQTVTFEARDGESGVARVDVILGRTIIGTRTMVCPHDAFAACPMEQVDSLSVDTRKVPDGNYPLTLRVTDAAGNVTAIVNEQGVAVTNRATVMTNSTNAARRREMRVAFVGRSGKARSARYGEKVSMRGRLTSGSGQPIAKTSVEIRQTVIGTRAGKLRARVKTDDDGQFVFVARVNGPSRVFEFLDPEGSGFRAAPARLRLNVGAIGTLRISLRGVQLRYSGQIRGAPTRLRGKRVYMEGRAVGGKWVRFAIKRTTRSGRFTGRYRLRVHRPGVLLQFRLRIPRETGYPYASGISRVVTRRVR